MAEVAKSACSFTYPIFKAIIKSNGDKFIEVNYVPTSQTNDLQAPLKPAATYSDMIWLLRVLLISLQGTHPAY